jgi:hypothetical protein
MMTFIARHPDATLEHMGYIPNFLDDSDPRPAREQINERYSYGGGWSPLVPNRWMMLQGERLKYPDDPPLSPICELRLRDERLVLYPASIVAIIQPDGSFEVSRLD